MAKETDRIQSGILGDINPVPAAKDHLGGAGSGADDTEEMMDSGSRRNHPEHSGEVGGTRNYREGVRLPYAYAIGVAGYAAGLLLSSVFDLPSGALIVWCLAVIGIGVYAVGPQSGSESAQSQSGSE